MGQAAVEMARVVYRLTIVIHIALGAITALIYVLFQHELVGIFTDKEDVKALAVSVTPLVALTDFGKFPNFEQ